MSSAIVVGAGGGELAAALELAPSGFEVTLLEGHIYPGGCAGTFYHQNYRFDARATLSGGFMEGGPMDLIDKRYGIEWEGREEKIGMEVHLPGQPPIRRWINPAAWKGSCLSISALTDNPSGNGRSRLQIFCGSLPWNTLPGLPRVFRISETCFRSWADSFVSSSENLEQVKCRRF